MYVLGRDCRLLSNVLGLYFKFCNVVLYDYNETLALRAREGSRDYKNMMELVDLHCHGRSEENPVCSYGLARFQDLMVDHSFLVPPDVQQCLTVDVPL